MAALQLALNAWLTRHITRIEEKIAGGNSPCDMWTGKLTPDGYSRYSYTCFFTGRRVNSTAHRVYYMVTRGLAVLETPEDTGVDYPGGWHVSHLCHVNACLNMKHLSHEPAAVNSQRAPCKRNNKCCGHAPFPDCLAFGSW